MKKFLLGIFALSILLFTACEGDIEPDVPSISSYDFVSFEDDNLVFELEPNGTSSRMVTVYNSKVYSTDITYNLQVLPDGFSDSYDTTISSDSYTVPATVTIPANERSAQFEVIITDDGSISSGDRLAIGFSGENASENPHPVNLNIVIVCPVNELILDIVFDNYPEETTWELYDLSGTPVVIASGGQGSAYDDLANESIQLRLCLDDGDYGFIIYDAYADGICCNYGLGSYSLTVNGVVIKEGGSFGANESTTFTP